MVDGYEMVQQGGCVINVFERDLGNGWRWVERS